MRKLVSLKFLGLVAVSMLTLLAMSSPVCAEGAAAAAALQAPVAWSQVWPAGQPSIRHWGHLVYRPGTQSLPWVVICAHMYPLGHSLFEVHAEVQNEPSASSVQRPSPQSASLVQGWHSEPVPGVAVSSVFSIEASPGAVVSATTSSVGCGASLGMHAPCTQV
jgi:hypothetical protein